MSLYAPRVIGASSSKLAAFRIQQEVPVGESSRYPLGRYPFKVDLSFGSVSPTRRAAVRINTSEAIKNSANKLKTKALWGNQVPHTAKYKPLKYFVENDSFSVDKFEEFFNYPVVAKRINASKGKGFTYIEDYTALVGFLTTNNNLSQYFFEELFEFNQEFRFHVSPWLKNKVITYNYKSGNQSVTQTRNNGAMFILQKKIKQEAYDRGVRHTNRAGRYDDIIFTSRIVYRPWMDQAIEKAVKAMELLGLDFGFVDVGYNTTTQQYIFFESGSNPELTAPETTCYKQALPHIILYKGRERMPDYYTAQINTPRNRSINIRQNLTGCVE